MPYFPPQQTAIQLLNKIKTVDGSGSGLDADTIDGLHANELSTVANLNDLTDVTISTPSTNQVLLFNGSVWVNGTITSGVTDHGDLTGLGDNDHPQYYLASNVSAYGASLVAAVNAATARTTLGLSSLATATETNYLLADGSRTGASSQIQTFTNGITTSIFKPLSDGLTAISFKNLSANTDVLTLDTTNNALRVPGYIIVGDKVFDSRFHLYVDQTNTLNAIRRGGFYQMRVNTSGQVLSNNQAGFYAKVFHETGGNNVTGILYGMVGEVQTNTTNTVTESTGIYTVLSNSSTGIVTTLRGLHVRLQNTGGGTVTNSYGVYIENIPTSSTNTFAIYTNTGLVRFGDRTIFTASTTARASLSITSGVAPTSPNNGDIWFDGTNLKIQISGVTKTFTVV